MRRENAERALLSRSDVFLRRLWMRFCARISRTLYSDDSRRLEKAYRLRDPWAMESKAERYRFSEINRLIREHLGKVDSVLELGSGEGHHTVKLLECCKTVDGLEVSEAAIARARARCPARARFFKAQLPGIPPGLKPRYDLVVASEVLYYLKNIEETIALMNRLGKFCLVSFFQDETSRLSPYFERIPGVIRRDIPTKLYPLPLWETLRKGVLPLAWSQPPILAAGRMKVRGERKSAGWKCYLWQTASSPHPIPPPRRGRDT